MPDQKPEIVTFSELFPDYQALVTKWNDDFVKMRKDIENVVRNLTTLSIEVKVDSSVSSRKTEIDLISGDVTITIPKEPENKEEMAKIQADALDLALKTLDKRIDALIKIVDVVCKALSPTGSLSEFFKGIGEAIKTNE